MEILTEFANLFSQEWMKVLASVVGATAVILKLWRDFSDLRYSATFKRPLERLAHLSEATEPESELARALKSLMHLEVFRIAFGIRTSPHRSEVLVRMFQTGLFSTAELRVAARFVEPIGDRIAVKIDLGDKVAAGVAGVAIVLLTVVFSAVQIQLLLDNRLLTVLTAGVLALIWLFVLYYFGADIRNLRVARATEKKLAKSGLLAAG